MLQEPKGLHFNLSHCRLAVACALSDGPVGVDVQDWAPRHSSVAKQVCCPAELRILERSAAPEIDFAKLWTRKESYGKYTGQGILYAMKEENLANRCPPGVVIETAACSGFALSYCGEKELDIINVKLQELLQRREIE